mgnify:CR=1 FL=1
MWKVDVKSVYSLVITGVFCAVYTFSLMLLMPPNAQSSHALHELSETELWRYMCFAMAAVVTLVGGFVIFNRMKFQILLIKFLFVVYVLVLFILCVICSPR